MSRYDVTQKEMAGPVGVDQSQLSKMVRGKRAINLDQLEIMCHVLGADVDEIVEEATQAVTNRGEWPSLRPFVLEGVRVDDAQAGQPYA